MGKFRWWVPGKDNLGGLTTAGTEAEARALIQRVLFDGKKLPRGFRIREVPLTATVDDPVEEEATLFKE